MSRSRGFLHIIAVILLGGCATVPSGPAVMVLPGPGKSFEVFRQDKCDCEQWALQQTSGNAREKQQEKIAGGAAVGTLVGAGLGAALGASSGNAGPGAAIGAGGGLIAGTILATGANRDAGWELQRRYDIAYQECMYAKGNRIPGVTVARKKTYSIPPPPPRRRHALPPPP